ncbi:hypothetical protein IP84_09455 [beta proteobacterium AAP99]|nr:hypothetical protein IP84_09455 [beta proteobacterium AAP99]
MVRPASPSTPRRPRRLADCIGASDADWLKRALALAELQASVDSALRALALAALRVQALRLENGELLLACASSAQKARLNHVRPELAAELTRRGWDCRSIRVGHQLPSDLRPVNPTRRQRRDQIDTESRAVIANTAREIENPALAQALLRLAQGSLNK